MNSDESFKLNRNSNFSFLRAETNRSKMHNYVLFNTFVHFIIQKLKNKHTFLKTEKAKFSRRENLAQWFFTPNKEKIQTGSYMYYGVVLYVFSHIK